MRSVAICIMVCYASVWFLVIFGFAGLIAGVCGLFGLVVEWCFAVGFECVWLI